MALASENLPNLPTTCPGKRTPTPSAPVFVPLKGDNGAGQATRQAVRTCPTGLTAENGVRTCPTGLTQAFTENETDRSSTTEPDPIAREMDQAGLELVRVRRDAVLPPDLYEKPIAARGARGLNDPKVVPCVRNGKRNYLTPHDMDYQTGRCRRKGCGATREQLARPHGFRIETDTEGYAVSVTRNEEEGK